MEMDWKRGGKQHVLRTYMKLHDQVRLGEHWLWVALERVANGEKVDAVLADYGYMAADEIDRLRQVVQNVYEVWAGSEGIPIPETVVEAYLLRMIEQMRDEAKHGLPITNHRRMNDG